MIDRLVILGATGDLASRYPVPAPARLDAAGVLPADFRVTAVGREALSSDEYRSRLAAAFDEEGIGGSTSGDLLPIVRLRRRHRERWGAVRCARSARRSLRGLPGRSARALRARGTRAGQGRPAGWEPDRVEKLSGEDLAWARQLNRVLAESVGEHAVHRVDHFLGKQTVQNLLGLRVAIRVFEPLWNRQHVERIEIVWEEELTIEGRSGHYDRVGALRDMVQSHLLQLLCLVAIEPRATLGERAVRHARRDGTCAGSYRGRHSTGVAASRRSTSSCSRSASRPTRTTRCSSR